MTDPLFDDVADRLVLAHRRVRALEVPDEEKARATRRLLAISDAAKHDLGRAAARLTAFLAELEAGRTPGDSVSDT